MTTSDWVHLSPEELHACPACGQDMPLGHFICMQCSNDAPNELMVLLGEAYTAQDEQMFESIIQQIQVAKQNEVTE